MCIPKRADADETEGFAFVEYENKADAERAVKGLNGWALDKTHTLTAIPYADFVSFSGMAETFVPPEIAEYKPRADLLYWLNDSAARDEFLLRWADTPAAGTKTGDVHQTEVFWADQRAGPQIDYGGQRHKVRAFCPLPPEQSTHHHAPPLRRVVAASGRSGRRAGAPEARSLRLSTLRASCSGAARASTRPAASCTST